MRGKIVLLLFVLTIVVIAAAFKYRQSQDQKHAAVMPTAKVPKASVSQAPSPQDTKQAAAIQPPAATAPVSDPQFHQWIREEAKSMDEPNVDGAAKEAQIRAVVAKITPSQAKQLRQTVNSPASLPREKILSAYLLVEGGINTRQELKDSITAPMTEQSPHDAHSESEIKGVREKSLRIMMIDGLFAQAKSDPKARETLAQAIVDSEDPYIKAYAQEKLDKLQAR